ncbi:flavin reductase family protein [Varunaivibrio sulfuroxidans]|uniref:Flavin reductase (DIM6/NTAB) family NADH-FMN oxidoreductase RutF n=1 Tax=Varunaivibrio sulfuroxidans TaxID=1773489 RepID=A0A4R3JG19_9PROT|nr:flavin reductase family protein [Varunaivibrio sulfuroxidans]TCS64243.1 flavin reductase (DIM6/NTAB) family NADH-FMN oxidoreductase RutF [Varunaivibrio sulfuroxidans]WES31316.1 flavin reductase family protein [Varunaivibrio sulfuroxidans]
MRAVRGVDVATPIEFTSGFEFVNVDQATFRNALSNFASGVTVVSACDENAHPYAMTVSAFTSLSLDPPLILVCIGQNSARAEKFSQARFFAVNVLSAGQVALSDRFARTQGIDFDGVDYDLWDHGAPILRGAVATLECERSKMHEEGDHYIMIGRVLRAQFDESRRPLLHFRREYGKIG